MKPEFEFKTVELVLSNTDSDNLSNLEKKEERSVLKKFDFDEYRNQELFFEKDPPPKYDPSRAYRRHPERPDLTYGEIHKLEEQHRGRWKDIWTAAKNPKSKVMLATNAWAWSLRKMKTLTDEFTQKLLEDYDFYICRHSLALVEHQEEKINWAALSLKAGNAVVYRLWPTESFKHSSSVDVSVSGSIGLTQNLDIVPVPVKGGVDVVWKQSWNWASALIQAWGVGHSGAGWKIKRDAAAPFSGDREFYLLLQLPRQKKLTAVSASLEVGINTGFLDRDYSYVTDSKTPIKIRYYQAK